MRRIPHSFFQCISLVVMVFMSSTAIPQSSPSSPPCPPPIDCGGPFSPSCPSNAVKGFFSLGNPWWSSLPGWKWQKYDFTIAQFLALAAAVQNPSSPIKPDANGNISIEVASGDVIGGHVVPRAQGIGIRESDFLNGIFASSQTTVPCLPSMLPIQAYAQSPFPSGVCLPLSFGPPVAAPGANGGYRLLQTAFKDYGNHCVPTKVILQFDYACLENIVAYLLATGAGASSTVLLEVRFETCEYATASYLGPGDTVPGL